MSTPIPDGRGRWRLTLHRRVFSGPSYPFDTGITELTDARTRRLEQAWNTPAQLSFTLDGHSPSAALILELQHDLIAWRWDETLGRDVMMFRGPVTQSEDEASETVHTTTYVCHDYLSLLMRRYVTTLQAWTTTGTDQDSLVGFLFALATNWSTWSQGPGGPTAPGYFWPGSYLPMQVVPVNPDGTNRTAPSGVLRDRSYPGGTQIGTAIDELAKVINGFDYDVLPTSDSTGIDNFRVFYPAQGITRPNVGLVYGSTVSSFTRSVNSQDYGNYWRVLGNNGSSDPADNQLIGEAWNNDANNVGVYPVGTWMSYDNAADVSVQSTLDQKAQGNLALSGVLMPAYTLGLRPGWYSYGLFNMGDTLPLLIRSGRLDVNTTQRVLAMTYAIGDDGQEDVSLVVGRAPVTLGSILAEAGQDINALVRR